MRVQMLQTLGHLAESCMDKPAYTVTRTAGSAPEKLLQGENMEGVQWKDALADFWRCYRCAEPNHPVFARTELQNVIPYMIHGDEGLPPLIWVNL